jgi:hypothetical protein
MAQVRSRVSRRNILIGLAGGAAASAGIIATTGIADSNSLASLLATEGNAPARGPLAYGGFAEWQAQVGTSFKSQSGHLLKLVEVQAFAQKGSRPGQLRDRAFIARFDITSGGSMAEDLYRVAHREGGIFDILLTSGSPDNPLRMLAVFN